MGLVSRLIGRKRWTRQEEFDPVWQERIRVMASYIAAPGAVADFGCGPMWLERHLPPGCSYLPIDLIRRDERTLVFDLNRPPLPAIRADVAVMSGILEYVEDLEGFAAFAGRCGFRQVIASYCTTDLRPNLAERRSLNWVNDKSLHEMIRLFLGQHRLAGLDCWNRNTIFVFESRG